MNNLEEIFDRALEAKQAMDDLIIDQILTQPFICGYCGRPYKSDNPFTCSERCDVLLDQAIDEERGK